MTAAPDIMNSTAEERRNYIKTDTHVLQTAICAESVLYFTAKTQKSHMKHIFVERDHLRKYLRITNNMLEK